MYVRIRGSRKKGHIKYGNSINALILGHEIRHGWQHLCLSENLQNPTSPDEKILLDRFIEADGRTIEFGVTLQIVHSMGLDNAYAQNLFASFDKYEKQICEYSIEKVKELGSSPTALKQAMRQVFDWWIAHAPVAPKDYDNQTEDLISSGTSNKLYGLFYKITNKGCAPQQYFNNTGINPKYVQDLVKELGELGEHMDGNYLTETTGLDFMNEFYTRPCNYKLERAAQKFTQS